MKRTRRCWHTAVGVALALVTTIASAQTGEPVPVHNGGFEQGQAGWQGKGRVVTGVAHSGERSLRLDEGAAFQEPSSDVLIPADSSHAYRLRVWVKTEGVSEQGATMTVVARGGSGQKDTKWLGGWLEGSDPRYVHDGGASPAVAVTGGTHGWERIEATIPAAQLPGQTRFLAVYLRHDAAGQPTGIVWFDDLTVQRLPKGAVPERQGPLVHNGGFENGTGGWGGNAGEVVIATAAAGSSSLRIANGHRFQQFPVAGGQHYRVSMWIRTENAPAHSAYVQMSFRGAGMNAGWRGPVQLSLGNHAEPVLYSAGGSTDWREFSAVIAAPKRAEQMFLYLRKRGEQGAAYYDEVSVKPTDERATSPAALRERGMAPAQPMISDSDFARPELINTGFEWGAAGWLIEGAGEVVSENAAAGDRSLELLHGHAVQGLKVEPGQAYRVSAAIRTQAAAEDTVSVRLRFRGGGRDAWAGPLRVTLGRQKQPGTIATGGTHGWDQRSGVVEVPRGMDEMLIYLTKSRDDGTAWFDAVSVAPTQAPALSAAEHRERRLADLLPSAPEGASAAAAIERVLAQAQQRAPDRLVLAEGGEARYAVHVASAEDATELRAAKELAEYLGRISSGRFEPLSHDANPRPGPLLVVGRQSRLTDRLCPDIPYDELGEGGFVIRAAGPHVVIAGKTPRGTLNGVYWLLDRKLGVRWFAPAYTHVPSRPTLSLDPPDEMQVPRFAYREIFSRDTDAPWYRARNLLNGASHHRRNLPSPPGLDVWSDYWPEGNHNFQRIVSKKKYGEEHPEYFAGGQLAMMNEDVRRIAADRLIQIIKKREDQAYGFSQEDRHWDPDPRSRAFAAAHGDTLAAPLVDMISEIARRVRREVPGGRVATLAYHWSFPAPTGLRVPENVVMTVAPIEADFAQPFNGPRNRDTARHIAQWARIADHIVIWDYITNFGSYIQPYPNLDAMFGSIQWLAEHPAIQGYFGQGSYSAWGAEFAELRAWVAARLLWDPDQDYDALVDEFVQGYYGDAGPYIRDYIDLMHRSLAQSGAKLTFRTQVTSPYLTLEAMRRADELFEQAEAAVADQPGFLRRVRTSRIGVDYVILLRRATFEQQARERGLDWRPRPEERLERFRRYVRAAGIDKYGEGVGSIASLIDTMRIDRRVPEPPEMVRGLPDSAWVSYQDLDLRRYGHTLVVEDELASDGGAIRMPGNVGVWGIQLELDNLPAEGRWELYAAVRVDPGDGAADAKALQLGIQPGSSRSVPLAEVGDGRYHWLKLPGHPVLHDPSRAMWIAPPNSGAIEALYVDRVIAVRAGQLP